MWNCSPEDRKTSSIYMTEDWIPVIKREGDSVKYWNLGQQATDTLYKGEIFKAKLYMPIKEFYDSLGRNIILKEQKMDFLIGEDTSTRKRVLAKYYSLKRFIKVKGDSGFIAIPVDSIIHRFNIDSVRWKAEITPSDTTYAISGRWYFSRR